MPDGARCSSGGRSTQPTPPLPSPPSRSSSGSTRCLPSDPCDQLPTHHQEVDVLCLIQCTSPFLQPDFLESGYKLILQVLLSPSGASFLRIFHFRAGTLSFPPRAARSSDGRRRVQGETWRFVFHLGTPPGLDIAGAPNLSTSRPPPGQGESLPPPAPSHDSSGGRTSLERSWRMACSTSPGGLFWRKASFR